MGLLRFIKRRILRTLLASYLLVGLLPIFVAAVVIFKNTKDAVMDRAFSQLQSVQVLNKKKIEDLYTRYMELGASIQQLPALHTLAQPGGAGSGIVNEVQLRWATLAGAQAQLLCLRSDQPLPVVLFQPAPPPQLPNADVTTSPMETDEHAHAPEVAATRQQQWQRLNLRLQQLAQAGLAITDQLRCPDGVVRQYLCLPVRLPDDGYTAVLALEIPASTVQRLLEERSGLGRTGESYLVGEDTLMRSNSRFLPGPAVLGLKVTTTAVQLGLAGQQGSQMVTDYRGEQVLSYYSPLNLPGHRWVLLTEIDYSEVVEPLSLIQYRIVTVVIISSIVIAIFAYLITRSFTNPVQGLRGIILELSRGRLDGPALPRKAQDEIWEMATAVQELRVALKKTASFARQVGSGNFAAEYTPLGPDDTLGHALKDMAAQLKENAELLSQQNRLKTLALLEGQENERRRIARELHDGISQMLTGIKFQLAGMDIPQDQARDIKEALNETMAEIRLISNNLMPSVLADFGLEAALRGLCKNLNTPQTEIRLVYDPALPRLSRDLEQNLYRIIQEAVNNALKYASPPKILIQLLLHQQAIELMVQDNGEGFDPGGRKGGGSGLSNMRERAQLLGGTFVLESSPRHGTTIRISLPLRTDADGFSTIPQQ